MTGRQLLIIDDSADTCEVLSLLLGSDGWTVRTATNSQELQACLHTHRFDVVLLDHALGDLTSADAVAAVRKHTPHAQIVLTSGSANIEHVANGLNLDKFLLKPFEVADLHKVLRNGKG